jgi:hypothetical protein
MGLNQVVRFMGVEQRCVQHDNGCTRSDTTEKLTDPANNLIPDIASFLRYARGSSNAYHKAGPLQYEATQTNQVSNKDIRDGSLHPSDVILVLNQRLSTDAAYRANIQRAVSSLNALSRRVLVVFFARSPSDEGALNINGKDKVFENLQETFCVNFTGGQCLPTPPADFLGNVVVRIAPGNISSSLDQYTTGCNRAPGTTNDDQCFQDFYLDLLTRNEPRSIEGTAKGFMEALMFNIRVSL